MSRVSEIFFRHTRSLALLCFLCSTLPADEVAGVAERSMGVDRWKDGWELLYGMGGTRSQLVTNNQSVEIEGHGGHFSTAVRRSSN